MQSINLYEKILEKYKMKLFNELIKLVWEDNIEQIDNLPNKVIDDDVHNKFDKQTKVNLIRLIMGLEPINESSTTLKDMIYEAINLEKVQEPVISIITEACKFCDANNQKNQSCLVRNKHINCNEHNDCSACGGCISKCKLGAISDKIQFIPMTKLLKDKKSLVYAIVAPAFVGQFGKYVTPGKLRTALKNIGFEDMIEVALAADMLTAKEAYEYCEHMKENKDGYFITSCCCPVWVSMIQTGFPEIIEHISPSVSPMIACGRGIKILNPNAKVVFIGPCTAKKKEATLDGIKDAVDFVLTFKELEEIFNALQIDPVKLEADDRIESSSLGRVYARSGGVSKSIKIAAGRIDKDIPFKYRVFQGAKECKEKLKEVADKKIDATFIEGMGCIGGCVGGPKRILDVEKGTKYVDEYSENTDIKTPFENINVIQFLTLMGIKKVESLERKETREIMEIFSRKIKGNK